MMGKYLNGYLMNPIVSSAVDRFVPAGWSEWDVAGWGYPEYSYLLNDDGTSQADYGHKPKDYLTSVIAHKGIDFINQSAAVRSAVLPRAGDLLAPHPLHARAP